MKELIKAGDGQRMTSLQIAEIAGKRHSDVMRAIRKMEPAWVEVHQRNFALVEYYDEKGENRPCYELTKEECLYIATKFNDRARAMLVKRWMDLEKQVASPNEINAAEQIAIELLQEAANRKRLPKKQSKLTDKELTLFNYVAERMPEPGGEAYWYSTEAAAKDLGFEWDEVEKLWENLKKKGYILSREFDDEGPVFVIGRYPD